MASASLLDNKEPQALSAAEYAAVEAARKDKTKAMEEGKLEESDKKGTSADVQIVASMPYASGSTTYSFRDRAGAFAKKLHGRIMSKDEDVAYGRAMLAGKTREEALAAADEAKRAQQQRFDEGVAEARALTKVPGMNTQPIYTIGPTPQFS
ncbi:hypothetical protein JCM10213_007945 [Rhodosporidiobolus nylandii]